MNKLTLITMTREMIEECLINSKEYRNAVIDYLMTPTVTEEIQNAVEVASKEHAGNKIAFIKRIRELSIGRALEFAEAFPHVIAAADYRTSPRKTEVTLQDAKNLADLYDRYGKPTVC